MAKTPEELERAGFVYVVGTYATEPPLFKIGRAKSIQHRLASIRTANPYPLCGMYIATDTPGRLERDLHGRLKEHRDVGEWFLWNGTTDAALSDALRDLMGWQCPQGWCSMARALMHQMIEIEAIEDFVDLAGGTLPKKYRPPCVMINADPESRCNHQVIGFDIEEAEDRFYQDFDFDDEVSASP